MRRGPVIALAVVLVGLFALTIAAVAYEWRQAGIDIGAFGWAVIGVATALSVALGAGLMWLVFWSARRGFDARANDSRPKR